MGYSEYDEKSKFVVDTILALHFKLDQFMYDLVHCSHYEIIIYLWIQNLYHKGKSCEEAVQLIYRARNLFLLGKKPKSCASFYPKAS
ncbi:hypothetical protein U6A24_18195 [Aquimarina gracilis]|uniref:BUB1 N-terminal domain-containing protein n=1 Tax=Aquimarina gracilis TaxID=874422 RepID=A0ABU5ZZU1_9FLAO|nr:hypothetical protein [Aquimarina gracilis]MEB3347412.1 hypothetical protein [Aquimarina gracilis]